MLPERADESMAFACRRAKVMKNPIRALRRRLIAPKLCKIVFRTSRPKPFPEISDEQRTGAARLSEGLGGIRRRRRRERVFMRRDWKRGTNQSADRIQSVDPGFGRQQLRSVFPTETGQWRIDRACGEGRR